MSELLTREEYQSIAKSIDFPRSAFIDGKYRAGSGSTLTTTNPATSEVLCEIVACNAADVDTAVTHARRAFEQRSWAGLHPSERKDVLIRLCKLMTRNRRELAVMECLDSGKPIRDCELIDIPETISTIKWHAEAIDKIYDQTAPVGEDAMAMIVREPIGVVAAVLPWNFPLLMLAWKIAPALAAGNSVIVKPAEQTSLTALRVAELACEAGIENCSASSRLIVHESIKTELLSHIVARTRDWKTGDPLNPANHLGALIDATHCKKVSSYLAAAKQSPLTGGTCDGAYIQPTIFDDVNTSDALASEEIFGPVLSVISVSSVEQAIQIANDTEYGLTASVYSANGKRAINAARALRAGTVTINCYGEGDITTPFGGYKQSGFGGRDNGIHAHDQYTEQKTIWIDLTDPAAGDKIV